jgi:hypothetical protein
MALNDLAGSDAVLIDAELPGVLESSLDSTSMLQELLPSRGNLAEAALECARPLSDRELPLVLAWSDGPLYPAQAGEEGLLALGSTLVLVAGRVAP